MPYLQLQQWKILKLMPYLTNECFSLSNFVKWWIKDKFPLSTCNKKVNFLKNHKVKLLTVKLLKLNSSYISH